MPYVVSYNNALALVVMINNNTKPIPIYTIEALMATGVLIAYLNQ
jgi:hypothetical protein